MGEDEVVEEEGEDLGAVEEEETKMVCIGT